MQGGAMRVFLRKILSSIVNDKQKKKLKRSEFRLKSYLVNKSPKIDANKFRNILTRELRIKNGDHIFCHASLSLLNTNLDEAEICDIILQVIGPNGSLTVPCYPPMASVRFMQSKRKFNVLTSVSGMGSFAEYVRKDPRSSRSLHPTKSIATIGLPQDYLNVDANNPFPFGRNTPYERLLDEGVKVIGIGVTMNYLSFVHVGEELDYDNFPICVNEKEIYEKICIDENGESTLVKTYVHDMKVVSKANPEKFVRKYLNKKAWNTYRYYFTPFFAVDAKELTDEILANAKKGYTIYD
ncbi:AAC(3) family N-acetyltransferase [Vibrio parahaemolyticus]|nr:hypothetical protein [Vibrio parahaemolyticus]EHR1106870.1 AAC(3) family N-acetyltransferase [Vibrio parahaemolyticus]NCN17237.1 AAC(3) family N-acetyltransferase [Vibrio parahaemolyticus]TOJ10148.1 hypothetical protein CGI46_10740 [Vibrio parahaemolyticus]